MDKNEVKSSALGNQHYSGEGEINEAIAPAEFAFSDIKQIIERERRHHEFVRTPRFSNEDEFTTVIGDEYTLRRYFERLEDFALKLSSSKDAPICQSVDRKGRVIARLTKIGAVAQDLCGNYDSEVLRFYERHEFSPRLAVMLGAMKKWSGEIRLGPLRTGEVGGVTVTPIECLFKEIRRALKSRKVVDAIKNHRRMERQNFRSCWDYVRWQLEDKRSRLLILRLDLYYRAFARDWGASIDAQEIHSRFLRALREDRIIKDVIGSISKREVGVDRGVHYHMLVAVDGHRHRDAANLTRMLGEHWIAICGNDADASFPKAAYFNCYTLKDEYEYNCIGLVRQSDKIMMKGLEIAIRYMCKETCHLRPGVVEIQGKDGKAINGKIGKRNLRKGIVKKRQGKKRGAPRKISKIDSSLSVPL